jgi:hypothetical protein
LILVALLLLACAPPPRDSRGVAAPETAAPPPELARPATRLRVRGRALDVEVVRTPEERAIGLMFRETLAPDSGMLFIFDTTRHLGFWMKNTLIPLDIAFADDNGIIVDIQRMAPLDTTTGHVSSAPARYAVEANLGWFAGAGVRAGDTIHGIPR